MPVFAQPVHPCHHEQDLQQNTQRHHNHALKQQLRQIPHRRTSFRFFPYCQYNTFAASLQAGIAVLNFCLKILLVSNRRLCYNSTLQKITSAGNPGSCQEIQTCKTPSGCRAPASIISRTFPSAFRATSSSFSRGSPAPANHRLPSTPSMPRGSGAMLSRCQATRACSSGRWTSQTSTPSTAYPQPSPSTRRPPAKTPAPRSAR